MKATGQLSLKCGCLAKAHIFWMRMIAYLLSKGGNFLRRDVWSSQSEEVKFLKFLSLLLSVNLECM
jgi:hypothetical protein